MAYSFAVFASEFGWTHTQILSLTARQFFLYLRQIEKVEARRSLQLCDVISYPHMGKGDRRRLIRRYKEILQPYVEKSQQEVDSVWNALRRMRKRDVKRRRRNWKT